MRSTCVPSVLLFVSFSYVVILAQNIQDNCRRGTNCQECIIQDPACAWCTDPGYVGSRCDLSTFLNQTDCSEITYPKGNIETVQNSNLTDAATAKDGKAIQVGPQIINVTLKVGEPQKVTLNVRLAEDYPLDIYYLSDLSGSFTNDLTNLKDASSALVRQLKLETSDLRIGFGGFLDKVTSPFVFTHYDISNCTVFDSDVCCANCIPPFSFRNYLSLTNETDQLAESVDRARTSRSLDAPEGSLDALLQVITCQDVIGWRSGARRMVIVATDASFHMAGDGKMAGITKRNDGLCHTDPETNEFMRSGDWDYPSVGQLNALVQQFNILPVFAVVGDTGFYDEVSKFIKGSFVGPLAANSENLVTVVTNAYQSIASTLVITDTSPDNIDISYTSKCFNQAPVPGSARCERVTLGDINSFDVEMVATDCSRDGEKQTFSVRPVGFDDSLTIVVDIICSCDCENNKIKDDTTCTSGNGTLVCGQCECDEGRYGQNCECDGEEPVVDDFSSCIAPNSTSVCSGRGSCVCGECVCNVQQNPNNAITGKFCECDNFSCPRYQGDICGGSERGECVCGECRCNPSYEGDNCGCLLGTEACETISGLLCNGFGQCECGRCICNDDSPFTGSTCSSCPSCNGLCASFRECALCTVFESGLFDQEMCDMCAVQIEPVESINVNNTNIEICEHFDENNCTVRYGYELSLDGNYIVYVRNTTICRTTPPPVPFYIDWRWLVIGIVAAILLIGIIIIALVRIILTCQERIEYAKFEKELKNAKKSGNDNPLYKPTTSTFQNPRYGQ